MAAPASILETTRDDEDCDLELGTTIREMIASRFTPEIARQFVDAVIIPTRPGTPERKRQDRVEAVLTARLDKLLSGETS